MTTPRDRVSFGHHSFPFFGLQGTAEEPLPLPMLPVRIRRLGGRYGRAFNAVLDTGSTRTLIPAALARANGVLWEERPSPLRVVGGVAEGFGATVDVAIVDANLPEVSCWEVSRVDVRVMEDKDLDSAIVGWDLLELFEIVMDRQGDRISLRLQLP